MKCLDCGFNEGTLLKQFQEQPEKNYSWYELSEMTEVCASCGSENIKIESENIILCDEQKLYDNNYITQGQLNKLTSEDQ